MNESYKLGMNEVVGLRKAMIKAFKPVVGALQEKTYWHENLKPEDAEYISRYGFIANSDNRGGLIIDLKKDIAESEHNQLIDKICIETELKKYRKENRKKRVKP